MDNILEDAICIKERIENICVSLDALKTQKKSLKNEFCELGLSLKIFECDFYRKIEEVQCECRGVDGVQSFLIVNSQDLETQATSRAILYLRLDFYDVLQRLIGLETEIDILECKVNK